MRTLTSDYEEQALDFLNKTGTKFSVKFLYYAPYFDDDKEPRDIYEIKLERNGKAYTFRFGQAICYSSGHVQDAAQKRLDRGERAFSVAKYRKSAIKVPTAYDVLSAITKSDPGTFKDFCADFGCSDDSIKAQKLYFSVQEEYRQIYTMFHDVMEDLQEIN